MPVASPQSRSPAPVLPPAGGSLRSNGFTGGAAGACGGGVAGFGCDSSIFPVYHDRYGIPDAPTHPHRVALQRGSLWEMPASVVLTVSRWFCSA